MYESVDHNNILRSWWDIRSMRRRQKCWHWPLPSEFLAQVERHDQWQINSGDRYHVSRIYEIYNLKSGPFQNLWRVLYSSCDLGCCKFCSQNSINFFSVCCLRWFARVVSNRHWANSYTRGALLRMRYGLLCSDINIIVCDTYFGNFEASWFTPSEFSGRILQTKHAWICEEACLHLFASILFQLPDTSSWSIVLRWFLDEINDNVIMTDGRFGELWYRYMHSMSWNLVLRLFTV